MTSRCPAVRPGTLVDDKPSCPWQALQSWQELQCSLVLALTCCSLSVRSSGFAELARSAWSVTATNQITKGTASARQGVQLGAAVPDHAWQGLKWIGTADRHGCAGALQCQGSCLTAARAASHAARRERHRVGAKPFALGHKRARLPCPQGASQWQATCSTSTDELLLCMQPLVVADAAACSCTRARVVLQQHQSLTW